MSVTRFIRTRWKLILNLFTLGALGILIYAIRAQLVDTIKHLAHVNGWALLLIIPIEALNYHAQTKLYQTLFRVVGNRLSYRFLFGAALELNFVNHVFPSGGAAGISYFGVRVRDGEKISGGKATLVQVMKLVMLLLSFELLIIFGLLCLAVVGHVNEILIMIVTLFSTLAVISTVGLSYIVGSKSRINAFFTFVTRIVNRMIQLVRPKHPETINIDKAKVVFTDFHDNYQQIKSSLPRLQAPFWYAFLANLTEVLAIYVVYMAFGHYVNVGAVILAYAVANFAGLVSVLPGGVGIYEGLMTAVMASAGVPARLTLPVTVMYRVINTLIQLPPGYYLYQRALRRGEELPIVAIKVEPNDDA